MKIVVATSPQFFIEENVIIHALFEEGLDILHISKPESEPIYCERLLTLIDPHWYDRIVVEDHFYLKNEYGLGGIHLTDRNPDVPPNYKGHVSRSCTVSEISKLANHYNYVDFRVTPSSFKEVIDRHKSNHKVFARGVTSLDEMQTAQENGLGGIILEDILWDKFDHHDSSDYKEVIDLFKKFRKAAD